MTQHKMTNLMTSILGTGKDVEPKFKLSLDEFSSEFKGVALLVTPEYEGIFRNGGIGTYYQALSENLSKAGLYIVLLICRSQEKFGGISKIPALKYIFSTHECQDTLELSSQHIAILNQLQTWEWMDYESYCSLFFIQAIANAFPNAYIYVEFPEMLGLGYRTLQAKRSGFLGQNCTIAVKLHSGQEWLQEAQTQYIQSTPKWFWQVSHYEQYSFEQADLAFFLSHFLKRKVEQYGWKTDHAIHLPYCFRIIEPSSETIFSRGDLPTLPSQVIPLIFFGRLEARKGLLIFLEALQRLSPDIIKKIHLLFLGKSTNLQIEGLQNIESQVYIEQFLGDNYRYSIVTDLFSQEAIQFVTQLNCPIVCLTSAQENLPNTALEMGQLPISLVVSDTGGFRESLDLIGRTEGLYWFVPGEVRSLAQSITQAIAKHPEQPLAPTREYLNGVNQRLLNQQFQYMKQGYSLSTSVSDTGQPRRWVFGMTSMEEQLFLEDYAQNQYLGQGEIVELGCWLGSSTISFAMGLEKNVSITNKKGRIHSYDLFIWSSGMEKSLLDNPLQYKYKNGDSFLDEYLERINPWKYFVEIYPSDLTEIGCQQGKIECLFIDAMKSWELANSILENFFPHLIPGLSLVIHQDFAHYYTSWIHLLMYRLRKYLVPIEHPFICSSRGFTPVQAIPNTVLQEASSFSSFTEAEVEAAFVYSLSITPEKMQANILAAKVMYFIHIKNFERAKIEFRKAIAHRDYSEWLELGNVQESAKTYFGIDFLS